jgi:hypothetical protein
MPHLEYFVACETISIDQSTNRVSLFNIMEELGAGTLPSLIPALTLIAAWDLDPSEMGQDFGVTFRVHSPNGEQRDFQSNFTATRSRQRTFLALQGLPIEALGPLRFEVLMNGERRATHNVTIRDIRPEEQLAAQRA